MVPVQWCAEWAYRRPRIIRIREHRIRGRSASVSVLPLRVRGLTTSPLYCDYGYKKYHTQYTRKRAKSKCKVTYMLHCIYIILVCMRCTSRDLVSDLLIATRAHRPGQSLSVVSCMRARAFRDKCQWTCWISVSPHLPCCTCFLFVSSVVDNTSKVSYVLWAMDAVLVGRLPFSSKG